MNAATAIPARIDKLPRDARGYPVPWFVAWVDGKPEFRAADSAKWRAAVKQRLCWVCGDKLGVHVSFLVGPMCGINRTTVEPPSHHECAVWSALNCPFLNNSRAVRRESDGFTNAGLAEESPGIALSRNPGVALVWNCRGYSLFPDLQGKPLISMNEPEDVEWYAEGRVATRAEVLASIDSGLPALEEIAKQQPGAFAVLERQRQRFEKWLPS